MHLLGTLFPFVFPTGFFEVLTRPRVVTYYRYGNSQPVGVLKLWELLSARVGVLRISGRLG